MPNKAPVDAVGGPQEAGPWPSTVDEIVEGEQYDREVELADGTRQVLTVTVTQVVQLTDRPGFDPADEGYAVSYQFDDPTTGGGA